jgi:hypothetical protein
VHTTVSPSEDEARLWSALVFGSYLFSDLDERDQMVLARRGGAVSPVTSYLAIEPGVRPSREGFDRNDRTRPPQVRMGATCTSGRQPLPEPPRFSLGHYLRDALARAWASCGGPPFAADITVETTLAEVVDVPVFRWVGPAETAVESCVREALWQLALPMAFHDEWARWTVRVGPGWLEVEPKLVRR